MFILTKLSEMHGVGRVNNYYSIKVLFPSDAAARITVRCTLVFHQKNY